MSFGYLNRCKQRDGRRNKSVKYQLWKFVGNFPKPYICLATAQKGIWLLFFTVTQLSQATIYEKQLTPKQGRAKGEMQMKTHSRLVVRPRHLPRTSILHHMHVGRLPWDPVKPPSTMEWAVVP